MSRSSAREFKVGALVLAALIALAAGIFLIGDRSNLFRKTDSYITSFRSVSGLNEGNPVQLNGVDVGTVRRITLPVDPSRSEIGVEITVDRRFSQRLREDSKARIKTLGLLGDKYVEITSGSAESPQLEPGSVIPSESSSAVDQLVESGGDVMANITQISTSLRNILSRMDQGEGLLGELVSDTEKGKKVTEALIETLESVQQVAKKIETGQGPLPRLINDAELAERIAGSVERMEGVLTRLESGDGLAPALLNDPSTTERFNQTLASMQTAADDLAGFAREVKEGQGLVPKLLSDEEFAERITRDLEVILDRLDRLSLNLAEGDGTVAKLIEDPQVYEALNDIVIGVNESRMLRWLIRNRQKAGIKKRYEDAQEGIGDEAEPESAAPPPS